MRYFIDSCRYGEAAGDDFESAFIVSVQFHTDEDASTKWLTNVQFTDIPSFYLTNVDIFDKLVAGESIDAKLINEFQGMSLTDNYMNYFAYFKEHPDDGAGQLLHFVAAMSLLDEESEVEALAAAGARRWVDEVEIPVTEYEDDYSVLTYAQE